MIKAIKAIQRGYLRAPIKTFVLSQRQFQKQNVVPNKAVSMQHDVKKAGA